MTATAMAREIAEQPEAVRRTQAAHLSRTDEIAALAAGRRVPFVSRPSRVAQGPPDRIRPLTDPTDPH